MGQKRKIDTSTLETLLGKHIPPVMQEMMDRISKSDHHKEWLTVYANNAVDDMLDVAGRILADQMDFLVSLLPRNSRLVL
jgi:hypothetical protein